MTPLLAPGLELAPGYRIAPVVHGCWQLATDHGSPTIDESELLSRFTEAVEAGFTTFDCADIYTGVERLLGRLLRGLADPDLVQLHTKYVPDRALLESLDKARVERTIDRSLRRLGRDVLDLVQFHWWDYSVPGWIEVGLWLDELRREGKIRHLGLTNFDLDHVRQLVEAGVTVTAVQVQYSVLDRRPAAKLEPWCHDRGIALLAYGSLAGGLLSDTSLGAAPPPASTNRSQIKYRLIIEELGGWATFQRVLAALAEIAGRRRVSLATVAIRWVLDRPGVSAAIVGTGRRNRLEDLGALFDPGWEGEDWSPLERALAQLRGPRGPVYGLERDPESEHLKILRMNLGGEGDGS